MSYKVLFERYQQGRIAVPMLKIYVKKGIITQKQFQSIIDGEYIED